MPIPLAMPKLGLTMEFGTAVRWLKAEGEPVRRGEPVVEIESDKAATEVESPADGRVGQHLVPAGTRVPVTDTLCHILAEGEDEPASTPAGPAPGESPEPARLTPAARRVARELGLDPDEVARAFPAGRVSREDLETWFAGRNKAAAVPSASPSNPESVPTTLYTQRQPLTAMRAAIARRMTESLRDAAQLTLTSEVDVTALVQFRSDLATAYEQEFGYRPTYTDFLVKAMARAVAAVPQINARWAGDAIEVFGHVDIGVAVALDEGLIVPVVRGVQLLDLVAVGRQVRDLAQRARLGQLAPGEASGSTITLTNLGTEGVDAFTPVLNPPEVAILGAGRVRQVPVLVGDQLKERSVMTLSLTIDHRVVDGVPGARYLRRVAELLAQPALLIAC